MPVNTDKILKDGEKADELDPSKLQYTNTQGKVVSNGQNIMSYFVPKLFNTKDKRSLRF